MLLRQRRFWHRPKYCTFRTTTADRRTICYNLSESQLLCMPKHMFVTIRSTMLGRCRVARMARGSDTLSRGSCSAVLRVMVAMTTFRTTAPPTDTGTPHPGVLDEACPRNVDEDVGPEPLHLDASARVRLTQPGSAEAAHDGPPAVLCRRGLPDRPQNHPYVHGRTGRATRRRPCRSTFIAKSKASMATAQSTSPNGKSESSARCFAAARLVLTAVTTVSFWHGCS